MLSPSEAPAKNRRLRREKVVLMGAVFPFLLRIEQDRDQQVGRTIGRLVSLNAVGAIAGPLVAGFLLIEVIGLWRNIQFRQAVGTMRSPDRG